MTVSLQEREDRFYQLVFNGVPVGHLVNNYLTPVAYREFVRVERKLGKDQHLRLRIHGKTELL